MSDPTSFCRPGRAGIASQPLEAHGFRNREVGWQLSPFKLQVFLPANLSDDIINPETLPLESTSAVNREVEWQTQGSSWHKCTAPEAKQGPASDVVTAWWRIFPGDSRWRGWLASLRRGSLARYERRSGKGGEVRWQASRDVHWREPRGWLAMIERCSGNLRPLCS